MKTTSLARGAPPTEATSFRHYLQSDLARRCRRNARYSLRAFAKVLGVDHATLSQILRGRRRLTRRTIERLGAKLGLPREAIEEYADRAEARAETSPPSSALPKLAREAAEVVADGLHFSILELVRLRDFRADSRWIARVLGATTDGVNVALQRLLRLGLLRMESKTRWVDASGDAVASLDDFAHATIEHLAERARGLWAEAMRADPERLRLHSSTTLAVRVSRLPEALALLEALRERVVTASHHAETDDVYRLEIHFFPVTRTSLSTQEGESAHGKPGHAMADRDK